MTQTEITPQSVNTRVDNMGIWGNGIEEKITQIQARLIPDVEHADAIVESMMTAEATQATASAEMKDLQEEIAYTKSNIFDLRDALDTIGAGLALDATGKNADERKQNLLLAQSRSEQYQEAKRNLRDAEKEKMIKQAHYDSAEREYKRLGEQLRNLRARLEHWTARAKSSIGE